MPAINPTPPVSSRYGAPMGRHTGPDFLCAEAGRVTLRRIRLDRGGYDPGGAYWGHGAPPLLGVRRGRQRVVFPRRVARCSQGATTRQIRPVALLSLAP